MESIDSIMEKLRIWKEDCVRDPEAMSDLWEKIDTIIIKKNNSSDTDLILGLRTFIACLRFNPKFSDIFREIGLLEVVVNLLPQTMQEDKLNHNPTKLEVLYLLLETSQYLLAGPNNLNCIQFNESGAARHVFNCLSKPEFFHLFVPTHSSSSDDGSTVSPLSRTSTPPLSASHVRTHPTVQSTAQHYHLFDGSSFNSHTRPTVKQLQKVAFTIIRTLILSTAGDEHLANLLGLLARNLDDLRRLSSIDTSESDQSREAAKQHQIAKLKFTYLLSQELNLKVCILKSLMIVLKESHRCRVLFRKAGGFIYIVSCLSTLEKSLPACDLTNEGDFETYDKWRNITSRRIWRLIKNSLMTIVVAMRLEPINVRTFSDEVVGKFTEAIRGLGCFNSNQKCLQASDYYNISNQFSNYRSIFVAPPSRDFSTVCNEIMKPDDACCQLFRFLYDMSLDLGDGTAELDVHLEVQESLDEKQLYHSSATIETKSISFDQDATSILKESNILKRRLKLQAASNKPLSLDLKSTTNEPAILTYPSIIITILDLIPSCPSEELMLFICIVVKSLLKHERNQQLLCEVGMISKLLDLNWRYSLIDKNHFLHEASEYMLEKLTKQSITAKELRVFFRLEEPLRCKNLDDIEVTESYDETRQKLCEANKDINVVSTPLQKREKIATQRIETFVNMMSDEQSTLQPPFVEFGISADGFSTLFMPSIAPINVKALPPSSNSFLNSTLDVHTNEKNGILGGVGSVERQFPPATGLTFSTWVCIEKFPARSSDAAHNIRLLTIYRGSAATGKEYSCFRVQVSALDRSLTVSTQEALLFDNDSRSDAQIDPDCNLSIWTPELLLEGRWHHIAITMNRSPMKQSSVHVYVDGLAVHHQRMYFISSNVGSTNSGPLGNVTGPNCSAAAYVNAFIGSLPQFRVQLKTKWKQGPAHLLEEPLNANFISLIYAMGPNFIGNLQGTIKLTELAKSRGSQYGLADLKHLYSDSPPPGHRLLTHQQSASVAQTNLGAPLTRVSSTNTSSSSQQQSSANSQNQFNLAEERVLMSLDTRATSLMTLSRMRRIYTRFDCRQVSRVLGLAVHENSTPILLLHNTGLHLNGPSRGIGAMTIGYSHVRCFVPNPTQQTLCSIGGCYILIGLVAQAESRESFTTSLKALVYALRSNPNLQAQMENIGGYQLLSVLFWKKKDLLDSNILKLTFALITQSTRIGSTEMMLINQTGALRELICECFDLWLQTDMIELVLEFIYDLISSNIQKNQGCGGTAWSSTTRAKNLKCLRDMDLLPRMLRLLPQYDSQNFDSNILDEDIKSFLENNNQVATEQTHNCDTKAVYLIKQTVFELLNRTPRQSDILYFGQFTASLLPTDEKERPSQTINLRNILLKSLLQMMTKNNQKEVNHAMQEELVRILGFDWFMLFISGAYLNQETITIGFLNMMIILSNDELYSNFKNKSSGNKGGWLKEPSFPTIDGKYNIQLLGMNLGVFFGMSGKRKAIRQEVLEASNFFLLSKCLTNLIELPRVYLMIFQTMLGKLANLESSVLEVIDSFNELNLDVFCDCLVGYTHHIRRKTLASMDFKCNEFTICLIYMIREIMCRQENQNESDNKVKKLGQYPNEICKFLMYLYNNNQEFQNYCQTSDELIDALSEALMSRAEDSLWDRSAVKSSTRRMSTHSATKELLELSRLIILDTVTVTCQANEIETFEHLHTFERFLESLSCCKEAQEELVDILLRQVLLMIDSTARHNSIKTFKSSENVLQFQLLLINSILISQIVTDKIWQQELYLENLSRISTILDHQLSLTEQIFNFNELLPKHNPPHAFLMQRVLNRLLLFALSRPMQHMSDKMLMLDLLKKIQDNRTIIILNHMHSPHSAEFFVCFVYCLMNIIENNSNIVNISPTQQPITAEKPFTSNERQPVHSGLHGRVELGASQQSSSALMLISMARKVWDSIYQSKKGVLSEAFDISLSLPAFTLETSLDLLQLKSDIKEPCERYWANFIESELKPKRRLQQRQSEPVPGTTTSSAVNLLSNRLTRVVNAANFVSRVVGATAGTMASNVNLVGGKLSQNLGARKEAAVRTRSDLNCPQSTQPQSQQCSNSLTSNQADQDSLFKCNLEGLQIDEASRAHVGIIEDYINSLLTQKDHKLAIHKYLCEEWLETEYEMLIRERALFGPEYGSQMDKWCLDLTEGPKRMRKKMVNYTKQFYQNYPYSPEQYNPANKSLRYRPPMSYDSHLYYMKTFDLDDHLLEYHDKSTLMGKSLDSSTIEEEKATVSEPPTKSPGVNSPLIKIEKVKQVESSTTNTARTPSPIKQALESHSSTESLTFSSNNRITMLDSGSPKPSEPGDGDDGDTTSFVDFSPEIEAETNSARDSDNIDSLSVLRLLEKNERISHMFRCSRVQGLDTYEGLLLFGREHFYLIDGFTLLKTREIKDIESLPPDAHDPIIPNSTPNILAHSKKTCAKFSFDSIVEVHKRRYLLQPIALEVFSSDGRNTLIVFPRNIRNKVYSRLMTVSTQLTSNVQESLAGQKSNVSVEGGSGLLSNLIGETSVTQRWVRGELSNFQYLMNLNTIAGRSYNDLMQYPIFPWILADYTSDYLDFSKQSTFRDLSRPVGAQTSERLEQFKRRYYEWDDTETPPYHYGTFYSSAMIVASYMVRMEPFTQHFLRLQGGHFDLADRMFHSINDSWLSASKHNMADIKELVPEFFYLPEFLKNENKYDLGIKQNGMKLDDVILPPWAKNDTREFIRLHRCALESDYVSAHLHEWIDLIFGYKQQGQAAVEAVNVFHHLFYEGNVDIYNTEIDPIKKNAVIGFINNFGQVPKQLFKKPHPVRRVTSSGFSSVQTSIPLTPILPSLTSGSSFNSASRALTHCPQLLKLTNTTYKELRGPVGQIIQIDKNIVAVEQNKLLIPPEYCRYIAWGHADRSLRLGLYDSERPVFVWEGSDIMSPNEVLCCTIPNSRTMITAGTEAVITVWKIDKMRSFQPTLNLYGHVEPVTCLASSQAYSIIVSGSRDRTAIIWDLNRFTFVRQIGGGPNEERLHRGPVSAIAINDSTGDIATCASSWLYMWTVNGELLACIDSMNMNVQQSFGRSSSISSSPGQLHILSVCFSQHNEWDLDEVIVTGSSDGSIAIWSMRYYQAPMSKAEIEVARLKLEESNKCMKQENDLKAASQVEVEPKQENETSCDTKNSAEPKSGASEPIDIVPRTRQRTDTMGSEWVRLSTSSTSTVDTIPVLRTADSVLGAESCDSFANESLDEASRFDRPTCSTPVSTIEAGNREQESSREQSPAIQHPEGYPGDEVSSMGNLSVACDTLDGQSMSKANLFLVAQDPSLIKFSKSDTSLVDSFVMVGDTSTNQGPKQAGSKLEHNAGVKERPQSSASSHRGRKKLSNNQGVGGGSTGLRNSNKLLPNHCWRRELYLRSLISRRNGKNVPVAVTSLTISRDHKTIFVGDACGKITSWSTS